MAEQQRRRAKPTHQLIISWLDILNAPLSTLSERLSILNQIELHLATLCASSSPSPSKSIKPLSIFPLDASSSCSASFWQIQSVAGFNLAESLLNHLARLHILFQQEMALFQLTQGLRARAQAACSDADVQRIQGMISETCISMTLLQGLVLSHPHSKKICERKAWMELLLGMALAEYCTDFLPVVLKGTFESQISPSFSSSPPSEPTLNDPELSLPTAFALDLLMCILVDSRAAQDTFSDMGGLQQIVQLSHKCGDAVSSALDAAKNTTPRDSNTSNAPTSLRAVQVAALKQTDLHCLEFRYFFSQAQRGSQISVQDLLFTQNQTKEALDSTPSSSSLANMTNSINLAGNAFSYVHARPVSQQQHQQQQQQQPSRHRLIANNNGTANSDSGSSTTSTSSSSSLNSVDRFFASSRYEPQSRTRKSLRHNRDKGSWLDNDPIQTQQPHHSLHQKQEQPDSGWETDATSDSEVQDSNNNHPNNTTPKPKANRKTDVSVATPKPTSVRRREVLLDHPKSHHAVAVAAVAAFEQPMPVRKDPRTSRIQSESSSNKLDDAHRLARARKFRPAKSVVELRNDPLAVAAAACASATTTTQRHHHPTSTSDERKSHSSRDSRVTSNRRTMGDIPIAAKPRTTLGGLYQSQSIHPHDVFGPKPDPTLTPQHRVKFSYQQETIQSSFTNNPFSNSNRRSRSRSRSSSHDEIENQIPIQTIRIPPSPAVRRAQIARARSVSPQKPYRLEL